MQKNTLTCASGKHDWVDENIYVSPSSGSRSCRRCTSERFKTQYVAVGRRQRAPRDPKKVAYENYSWRVRRHGLSVEKYEALLEDQGGRCASCGAPEPTQGRRLAVDHDHSCCPGRYSCGRCVRGLLCTTCNVVAGQFESQRGDSVRAYLDRWSARV